MLKDFRVSTTNRKYSVEYRDGKKWIPGLVVLDKSILDRMVSDLKKKGCKVST